jgi:subtilase family serine protease
VPVGGGPSPAINADSLETTLDVEAIVGTAPGTSLYVYETSSLEYAKTLDAYEQIVSENRVGAVNSSFGGCETETNPRTYPRMVEKIAEQGAALGIVFSASTGDDGSYACSFSGAGGVNAPASAPSFVAVGGTTLLLQQNGAYSLELGWDGSGGGVSSLVARPAYQRGVRGVIGNRRNLPDVAFDADPGSGMSLYFRGRWAGPIGGTSLASPLFTALCTELAQNAGHRIGANVHGSIYGAFAAYGYRTAGTTYFHDATFGSNGSYSAKPGYDQVTGIGSLDGWNVGGVAKLSAASVAARAPAGARFAISLALRDRAGLEALIRSQSDPSSPMYAHFLSARAFRDAFAPTPEQYAATLAALRRAGFTIEATSPNRTLIDVRGTSANLARATRAAFSAMQSIVGTSGVLARTATSALQPSLHAIGATTALQTVGPDGGFAPLAVTAADDFPVRHGVTGKGVTVADVIDGAPDASDLATFAKRFGGTRAPDVTVVPVDGGKGTDVLQPDVDFEWIAAAAPGAKELDYEVPQLGAKEAFDAYTEIVSDDRADVVNASWGTCDASFVTLALALQPVFAQGAAEGIAFEGVEFGAPCGGWVKPLPMTPGDTADGLAVGGSYATEGTAGTILQQTALIGSDGGVSILVPVPPEQRALSGVSPLGRNAPDLVIPATVNGAGASIYAGGAWVGGGAFVNNAPAAGLLATLQQMKGHRLGAFDRTLDVLFAKRGYGQIFVDITAGCIGAFEGAPICSGRGFDLATGVGGVDGYALGKAL